MTASDFWQNQEKAAEITQKLAGLKEETEQAKELEKGISDLKNLAEIINDETEIGKEIDGFEKSLKVAEMKIFLSGRYDQGNAILSIYSGAGGQDAQDWVTLLLRMYERYSGSKGFKTKILDQAFGEAGGPEGRIGTKAVTLEIRGNYAYGFLKKETGVHRLVRISPFSAKDLRHTSFALVEVLPEISKIDKSEIKVRPEDLKTEFYHSSGPGGQYVNKRMTAVRITHLPTNLVVSCQSERSQAMNKDKATEVLMAKLYQLQTDKKAKEIKDIKGDKISASWSNQIRNYVLHPYKLVKDLRTNLETSNAENVLDGNLDEFIEAEIKL